MKYEYTLRQEEYMDYCVYTLLGEESFRRLRHRCYPVLPVILVFLIILCFPVPWWSYLLAVISSLLWILLVNYLTARAIRKAAAQRCIQAEEKAYRPLRVELEEDKLLVNGKAWGLKDYRLFSNLILLFLEDDACVVLPQRVFGKEQANLRQVLDHLDRYLIK